MNLEPLLKAVLIALADACNYSVHAHPPEEKILGKFPTHLRGDARKALKQLRRLGLAQQHPTKRATTWSITREGLKESQA